MISRRVGQAASAKPACTCSAKSCKQLKASRSSACWPCAAAAACASASKHPHPPPPPRPPRRRPPPRPPPPATTIVGVARRAVLAAPPRLAVERIATALADYQSLQQIAGPAGLLPTAAPRIGQLLGHGGKVG